jgi:2Fe-2S ferredoxin
MKHTVTFMPDQKSIQIAHGTSILEAARKARVSIRTRCDGRASCLMCKVKVPDASGLAPPNERERNKLGHLTETGLRLACQAKVTGDVTAEVPEDPLKAVIRAQLEAARKQRDEDDET